MGMSATLLAIVLLASGAEEGPEGPLVAVLELKNSLPVDRLQYAEKLRYALNAEGLHVMMRGHMQELAQANPSALDRCNDKDCVEVGRLLGADIVVEGELATAEKGVVLSLRAVDTRARKVVGTARLERKSPKALLDDVREAARQLADGVLDRPPRPPAK